MSARGRTAGVDPSKLALIQQGKKEKNVKESGTKQNVKMTGEGGKIIAIEKEKKVEEAGVTRKKRNFVMFESKTATEKDVDLLAIAGQKKAEPRPRMEETIVLQKKKKEYLDNYNYHETRMLNKDKGSVVIHERLGGPVGGTVEEYSYQKTSVKTGGVDKNKPGARGGEKTTTTTTTKTTTRTGTAVNESNLRGRPQGVATSEKTTTTRVGRRSGNDTSVKETTSKTVTTGGETKTSTRTTTTRGRK